MKREGLKLTQPAIFVACTNLSLSRFQICIYNIYGSSCSYFCLCICEWYYRLLLPHLTPWKRATSCFQLAVKCSSGIILQKECVKEQMLTEVCIVPGTASENKYKMPHHEFWLSHNLYRLDQLTGFPRTWVGITSVTSTFHRQWKVPMKIQATLLFYKGDLILTSKTTMVPKWASSVLMHSMESKVVLTLATQQKLEKKETRPAVLKEVVHCWPTEWSVDHQFPYPTWRLHYCLEQLQER